MTSQVHLVRASFELIGQSPQAILMLFYGRLFSLDPSLRSLFKTDMPQQARKLGESLSALVDAAGRIEDLRPSLREMGRRHVSYGVLPAHYEPLRSALLWALGQALQQDFDSETRAAWDALIREVSAEMICGATEIGSTPP